MGIRDNIHRQLSHIITHVAMANEAEVEFKINEGYPVTINDPELGEKMLPTLKKVFGENQVIDPGLITGAEDFSFFANEVPGLYFFMGVTPKDQDAKTAPTNHSPHFYVDEPALLNGVRAFVQLVEDY
jgi:amidohydrolase